MSQNIVWQRHRLNEVDYEKRAGHRAAVLWFTGFSASGKSSVADYVVWNLFDRGCRTFLLDGDNIRHGINKDLDFSPLGRKENIRRVGEISKLFLQSGHIIVTAFISPYRQDRESVRKMFAPNQFLEIFTDCPLSVCEERDPKGLYKRAHAGEIADFTGIGAPYEAPLHPDLLLDTNRHDIPTCGQQLINELVQRRIIAE